jgi:drug/metabolite transporter (DMT)-like permease
MNKYLRYALLTFFFIAAAARDVVSKLVLDYLDPLRMSAVLAFIAVITCLLISLAQTRLRKDRRKNLWDRTKLLLLFFLSVTTALAVYLGNLAIVNVGPVTYKIIEVVTYPSWVALFMFIFMRQAVPKKDLIATAIALLGFLLFYSDRFDQFQVQWLGMAASLGSALFYAASLILAKELLAKDLRPASLVTGRFLLLGMLALTASPVDLIQLPPRIIWYLLGLGTISFMFYLIREVPASTMAVFIAGAPIFSAILAWLMIPGTKYTWIEMVGLVIIVAGMLVAVFIEEDAPRTAPIAAD